MKELLKRLGKFLLSKQVLLPIIRFIVRATSNKIDDAVMDLIEGINEKDNERVNKALDSLRDEYRKR